MTCTDNEPCIACEMERLNQGRPPRSIERGPTVLEAGMGGMAWGFAAYAALSMIWGLGVLVDWLLRTVPGLGWASFAVLLGSGFLAGVWYATVGRR